MPLDSEGRRRLARLARGDCLLAFDFDGTLAPIRNGPAAGRMSSRTRTLLVRLAKRRRVAILSGRALDDLQPRLKGVPVAAVAGNHGAEWTTGDRRGRPRRRPPQIGALKRALEDLSGLEGGSWLEDKRYGLAVHFHRLRPAQRRAVAEAAGRLTGGRVLLGARSIEILPRGAPDKGVALRRFHRLLKTTCALYVGDDRSDEDAFAVEEISPFLSVKVGRDGASLARYRLAARNEVDLLMAFLLDAIGG